MLRSGLGARVDFKKSGGSLWEQDVELDHVPIVDKVMMVGEMVAVAN